MSVSILWRPICSAKRIASGSLAKELIESVLERSFPMTVTTDDLVVIRAAIRSGQAEIFGPLEKVVAGHHEVQLVLEY